MEKITVLSLFDGIGCARVALERAEIAVGAYYASEIEESSIKILKSNYADAVEIGDVRLVRYENGVLFTEKGSFVVGEIDLVCGGSPCTNFSSVGYANGMTVGEMEVTTLEQYLDLKEKGTEFDGQSYLFWEFVRILKETTPKYYLLENVKMAKKWEDVINKAMGVDPVRINSSLLSAQNRPRLYWTNLPGASVPEDKGIMLDDILDPKADKTDYTHTLTVQRCFPRLIEKYGYVPERFNAYNAAELHDKACALSRGSMVTSSCATLLFVPMTDGKNEVKDGILNGAYKTKLADGRYNIRKLSIKECERLQTLPDGYTSKADVTDQKRSEAIGNGWTVDVIAHLLKGMAAGSTEPAEEAAPNGFAVMAESYRKLAERGRISKEQAEAECRILEFLATCSKEDIYRLADSSAFNDVIRGYAMKALDELCGDEEIRSKAYGQMTSLFDGMNAKKAEEYYKNR